jgi:hypothetical protein
VFAHITDDGLALLQKLDQPIRDLHHKLLGHLGSHRLRALSDLLRTCRGESV